MKTRGGQLVRCYTGKVNWTARRGADIEPVIPTEVTAVPLTLRGR